MPTRFAFTTPFCLAALAAVAVPAAAAAGPLEVTSTLMAEYRVAAADGTTRIALAPAARLAPGDRVVVVVRARNTGTRPIADLLLANPLPPALAFVGGHAGSPEPEVSADGRAFAPAVAATRSAVRAVRWRLTAPLAPGGEARLAFDAAVR